MKRALAMMAAACWGALGERDRLAGRYRQARRRLRRALAVLRKADANESALAMGLWNSLGIVCKGEERLSAGAHAYRMALRLARRNLRANDSRFASLYHNLAGLEHARGAYESAESLARHGLSIRELALGDDHPDVGRDLAALAAIPDGQGRHDEAETMHRRALEIFGRGGRSEQREAAYALANLAACRHLQGRRDEAVEAARKAVAMQHRLLGARHPDVKLSEANLATVERAQFQIQPGGIP